MNEEEKEAIDFLKETNFDYLDYDMCVSSVKTISNLVERLQKENEELKDTNCLVKRYFKLKDTNTYLQKEHEELKEKENKIYEEVQESLSFERFLIAKEREPDSFNQGRFYISQIIYDILNNAENPEGIHKENKYIKYINYIPIQKIKDKIEEIQGDKTSKYYDMFLEERDLEYTIKILQELLESE